MLGGVRRLAFGSLELLPLKRRKSWQSIGQNSHMKSELAIVQLNENTNVFDQAF